MLPAPAEGRLRGVLRASWGCLGGAPLEILWEVEMLPVNIIIILQHSLGALNSKEVLKNHSKPSENIGKSEDNHRASWGRHGKAMGNRGEIMGDHRKIMGSRRKPWESHRAS